MNLRQLEYFLALAETEHMTKAAKQLQTSQPNISHAMSTLEQELGVSLFKKNGRNIFLTKNGRLFYSYVAPSLQEIYKGQKVLNSLANPVPGEIHFGFIYTVGSKLAPGIIKRFKNQEVHQNVQFEFYQGNSKQIVEMLKEGIIDVGVCSKVKNDPEIQFSVFAKEELVVVVPDDHPLAEKDAVFLEETIKYPVIYYTKESGLRPHLDSIMNDLDIHPKIEYELDEDHSVLGFVESDFGIAFMPSIPSISSYGVKKLRILDRLPERYLYLATKRENLHTPIIRDFWDFCRNEFES
ncbi:LysR family transcriptional regulator [Enterococcus florum]|uniref:LysR family transcriptional regulator n=1 Tax=Enterococcus florum TaxID=2480627 RepID=A0A4P5PHA9_9ENTE|nr:LysR family transcriptional regulator [Enterococcus florum]GCF95718.1 LysR family transcriptional regulator [Enterococcus florum]